MDKNSTFNLKIEFCEKERQIFELYGREFINSIINNLAQKHGYKCKCCNYIPINNQRLNVHVIAPELKEITLENVEAVLLCEACFAICHFEQSVNNDYFVLSNSSLSQIDIINLHRQYEGLVQREIDLKKIVLLSKTSQKLMTEMKDELFKDTSKIKLLFTKNFSWKNSK